MSGRSQPLVLNLAHETFHYLQALPGEKIIAMKKNEILQLRVSEQQVISLIIQ